VVHRDIKPGNVLLCSLEEGVSGDLTTDNVKVTDFGISVPYTPGRVSNALRQLTFCWFLGLVLACFAPRMLVTPGFSMF
jgi:serine/threonine protein kinase